jgi:hypothetical protein
MDEALAAFAKNESGSADKIKELEKDEFQSNLGRILTEGMEPCIATGFENGEFFNVRDVLFRVKEDVAPRHLKKQAEALVSVTTALNDLVIKNTERLEMMSMSNDEVKGYSLQAAISILVLLLKDKDVAAKTVPIVMEFLDKNPEDGSIAATLYELSQSAPELIAPRNDVLCKMLKKKVPMWSMAGMALGATVKMNPDPVIEIMSTIADLADGGISNIGSINGILSGLAEVKPEAFDDDIIEVLIEQASDPTSAGTIFMSLPKLAASDVTVNKLEPLMAKIEGDPAPFGNQMCAYGACDFVNTFCTTKKEPERGMKCLLDLSKVVPSTLTSTCVFKFKGMYMAAGVPKEALDPFRASVDEWAQHSDGTVKDGAKAMIAYREGRDLESTVTRVDETETKVDKAVETVERVDADMAQVKEDVKDVKEQMANIKEYVDEQIGEVKDFLAEVTKKLPAPAMFGTRKEKLGAVNVLILHFECGDKESGCLYPGDGKTFTTETSAVSKWLKVGWKMVHVGIAVMEGNVVGGLDAVKDVYDTYRETSDPGASDFEAFIHEPFLTSSEQDKLIEQLRDAKFFENFGYNAQAAQWRCTRCNKAAIAEKEAKEKAKAPPEEAKVEEVVDAVEAKEDAEAAAADSKPEKEALVRKESTVYKRGKFLKGWKERWLVLDKDGTVHNHADKGSKAKGVLFTKSDVAHVDVVPSGQVGGKNHAFAVVLKSGGRQVFACANGEDCQDWVDHLKN